MAVVRLAASVSIWVARESNVAALGTALLARPRAAAVAADAREHARTCAARDGCAAAVVDRVAVLAGTGSRLIERHAHTLSALALVGGAQCGAAAAIVLRATGAPIRAEPALARARDGLRDGCARSLARAVRTELAGRARTTRGGCTTAAVRKRVTRLAERGAGLFRAATCPWRTAAAARIGRSARIAFQHVTTAVIRHAAARDTELLARLGCAPAHVRNASAAARLPGRTRAAIRDVAAAVCDLAAIAHATRVWHAGGAPAAIGSVSTTIETGVTGAAADDLPAAARLVATLCAKLSAALHNTCTCATHALFVCCGGALTAAGNAAAAVRCTAARRTELRAGLRRAFADASPATSTCCAGAAIERAVAPVRNETAASRGALLLDAATVALGAHRGIGALAEDGVAVADIGKQAAPVVAEHDEHREQKQAKRAHEHELRRVLPRFADRLAILPARSDFLPSAC